jgi:uncharacterized protein (DUF488 family)
MPDLHTIGHGNRTLDELIAALDSFDVDLLVDVRRYPGSRRNPHFGRDALAQEAPAHGISYRWEGEALGGRRRASPDSRHHAWKVDAFRAYADFADEPAFVTALEELEQLAARHRIAIMCAETLWWRCHRRLISDHLITRGNRVDHIFDAGVSEPHRLPPFLRLDESGRPVYDVGETPPLIDPADRKDPSRAP